MPRLTVRGYVLLGVAAATYLAARLVGTWELYLFTFGFLAVVVLSWCSVAVTGRRVRVTRTITPEQPVAGDEPEVAFCLKNASFLPGPELTLRSPLAGMGSGDLELEVESLAPRGERLLKTHTGRVNRGVHVLPPMEALAEDTMGISRSAHKVSEALVVTVLPRIAPLDSCALYPDLGLKHDWSGRHGLLAFGASEFRGVRPHQPGEPLSHIDWKSTAKTGVLMLREMEEPAGADVTMLLDGTAARLVGRLPDTNFELAVRAAGSVADFVLRSNRGVSLLCHERSWRQVRLTPDGGGRRALLQVLAETRPDATAPLKAVLRRLRTDGPHLTRAQSITLVSISLDHELVRTLIQLREDGVRLAFLYIAGTAFALGAPEGASPLLPFLPAKVSGESIDVRTSSSSQAPAASQPGAHLSAEDRSLLLSMSSAGIPCLTLSRGDDLIRSLSLWRAGHARGAVAL